MLESVKQLDQMGFQLFASLGTADFYSDSGVKVWLLMYIKNYTLFNTSNLLTCVF